MVIRLLELVSVLFVSGNKMFTSCRLRKSDGRLPTIYEDNNIYLYAYA